MLFDEAHGIGQEAILTLLVEIRMQENPTIISVRWEAARKQPHEITGISGA